MFALLLRHFGNAHRGAAGAIHLHPIPNGLVTGNGLGLAGAEFVGLAGAALGIMPDIGGMLDVMRTGIGFTREGKRH